MRDVTIGNGKLTLCGDAQGWIREIFYPQPGLWNHTLGAPCKAGIRLHGVTTWLGDDQAPQWHLIDERSAEVSWSCPHNGLTVACIHNVDAHLPVLRRQFRIKGKPGSQGTLLLHHDFRLLETEYQDGVRFEQAAQCLHHYKRQAHAVIGFLPTAAPPRLRWTLGRRDANGGQGITVPLDSDILDNNPCAVGAGESVLAAGFVLDQDGMAVLVSYLAMWDNNDDKAGVAEVLAASPALPDLEPRARTTLADHVSLAENVLAAFRGAAIASPDSETLESAREHYGYIWPRDGAFVAMTWDSLGDRQAARAFYDFCSSALTDEGFLHQRYSPDGTIGSSWHPDPAVGSRLRPIQEDSTALVCLAASRHILAAAHEPASRELAESLVFPTAGFLISYRDEATGLPLPSHDLWEERFGIHTFTVASVIAALRSASEVAKTFDHPVAERLAGAAEDMQTAMESRLFHQDAGRYARMATVGEDGGLHLDVTPDASLSGLFLFDTSAVHDEKVALTMKSVEEELWVGKGIGGIARYRDDHYHRRSLNPDAIPGNPWLICTLWLAHWHALRNTEESRERAAFLVDWVLHHARPSGALPEQVHPLTGENVSVCPLLWSHSTLIDTARAMNTGP